MSYVSVNTHGLKGGYPGGFPSEYSADMLRQKLDKIFAELETRMFKGEELNRFDRAVYSDIKRFRENNPEKLPVTGLNLEFEKYLHNYYKDQRDHTNIIGVEDLYQKFLKGQQQEINRQINQEYNRRLSVKFK